MKRIGIVALVVGLLAMVGGGIAYGMTTRNYGTHLAGRYEVPVVATRAQGQAILRLSPDGQTLHYRLIVANIDDVTMAHLHLGPAGANGPIVVWLYPDAPPARLIEGRSAGTLATGHITAADLVGPLAGQPLSALLDAIEAGNVYVNVHTSDFPGGEIRGQVHEH